MTVLCPLIIIILISYIIIYYIIINYGEPSQPKLETELRQTLFLFCIFCQKETFLEVCLLFSIDVLEESSCPEEIRFITEDYFAQHMNITIKKAN